MDERIREAMEMLKIYLDYPDCDLCCNCGTDECMWCEDKGQWGLSNKAAEMLVKKIEAILIPTGHWVRYEDDDEYYCSYCEWPAPRDVYGHFRDQPAYCPVCGAKMDLGFGEK